MIPYQKTEHGQRFGAIEISTELLTQLLGNDNEVHVRVIAGLPEGAEVHSFAPSEREGAVRLLVRNIPPGEHTIEFEPLRCAGSPSPYVHRPSAGVEP